MTASSLTSSSPWAVRRTLRQCLLFSQCPPELLRRIGGMTVARALDRGEYLFHEGSPVHGLYVVARGAIKIHRVNPLGREQVIHVFRAFESFAEESLVAVGGHQVYACATEPSEVLLVRKAELLEVVRHEPELALGVLRSMYRHTQILVRLLDDLTLKDVKTRLAHWLLQQCPDPASRHPIRIQLPSTKRVLAAELGTVSETLSRTVAKLRAQRLLSVRGGTVTLHCPRRLNRLVGPRQRAGED